MRGTRLGCFSTTGILAALLTALVITGVAYVNGGLLYSPGRLNAQAGEMLGGVTSHAETRGQCEACHVAPWSLESMADRCTICHGEIGAQMQSMVSLHGAMYQTNPKLHCRNCHPEHRGAQAPITVMEGGEFPHELLGYSLNGHRLTVRGEAFVCSECHSDDITTFAPDSCQACHRQMDLAFAQAHTLSFGQDCLACHDGIDSLGQDFSHQGYAFQLTGLHQDVICAKCHLDARKLADFQAAPRACFTCHQGDDPHQARFGADCAACHTPDGWTPAKFDHNLAAFKLEGAHAEVACENCHRDGAYRGTPADCYSCHRNDDEHDGAYGTDCATCHNPIDWKDATFDHNRSNFPLTGRHIGLECTQCHTFGQFSGLLAACVSCHADPPYHAGMFGVQCEDCHTTNNWFARYTGPHPSIDDESGINHEGATCRDCHPASLRTYTCLACHDSNNPDGDDNRGGDDD